MMHPSRLSVVVSLVRPAAMPILVAGVLLASCAGQKEVSKRPPAPVAAIKPPPPAPPPPPPVKKDDGLAIDLQIGYLKQEEAEDPIQERWDEFTGCYERAGKARRFADGTVKLRFLITRKGDVSDVLVIDSQLGNFDVERCLIEIGRTVQFRAPEGGKSTSFDFSLQFKSTREMIVIEWPKEKIDTDLADLLPQLDYCDRLGPREVAATMYIARGGTIASAGFSAPAVVDPLAADCVLKAIRGWKLPPSEDMKREIRKLVVARTTFAIRQQNPDSRPKPAPTKSSGRKKRPSPGKRVRS